MLTILFLLKYQNLLSIKYFPVYESYSVLSICTKASNSNIRMNCKHIIILTIDPFLSNLTIVLMSGVSCFRTNPKRIIMLHVLNKKNKTITTCNWNRNVPLVASLLFQDIQDKLMSYSQGIENERASIIFVVFNGICSSSEMKMKTKSGDADIYSMFLICGMSSSRIQRKAKIFISQLYNDHGKL